MAAINLFFTAYRPFGLDRDPRGRKRAVRTGIAFYYMLLYHTAGIKIKRFCGNWRTIAEFSHPPGGFAVPTPANGTQEQHLPFVMGLAAGEITASKSFRLRKFCDVAIRPPVFLLRNIKNAYQADTHFLYW
jgi:hypothetical protein